MMRLAAAVALWVAWSITPVQARDTSSCPPTTSVRIIKVKATTYNMQISARNTCTFRINFRVCSHDRPKSCEHGAIGPGETRIFKIDTTRPDGKADFNWQ